MAPKLFIAKWILIVFVIDCVYCRPDPDCGQDDGNGGGLEVVISFDSLNCNSQSFFKDKLKPIYDEMSKCVKWHFIPCSTSHIVQNVLQCQGGAEECDVDAIHACAAHYYENDENSLGKFFLCMMASGNQKCNAQKCANEAGLDWNKLQGCKPCNEAGQWCDNRWKQLNALHEPNIPGVMFDMKYNAENESEAMCDLKGAICNQIKKKNLQCAACGNSGGGGGGNGSDKGGNPDSNGMPPSNSPPSNSPSSNSPPSNDDGGGGGSGGDQGGQGNYPPPSGGSGGGGGGNHLDVMPPGIYGR